MKTKKIFLFLALFGLLFASICGLSSKKVVAEGASIAEENGIISLSTKDPTKFYNFEGLDSIEVKLNVGKEYTVTSSSAIVFYLNQNSYTDSTAISFKINAANVKAGVTVQETTTYETGYLYYQDNYSSSLAFSGNGNGISFMYTAKSTLLGKEFDAIVVPMSSFGLEAGALTINSVSVVIPMHSGNFKYSQPYFDILAVKAIEGFTVAENKSPATLPQEKTELFAPKANNFSLVKTGTAEVDLTEAFDCIFTPFVNFDNSKSYGLHVENTEVLKRNDTYSTGVELFGMNKQVTQNETSAIAIKIDNMTTKAWTRLIVKLNRCGTNKDTTDANATFSKAVDGYAYGYIGNKFHETLANQSYGSYYFKNTVEGNTLVVFPLSMWPGIVAQGTIKNLSLDIRSRGNSSGGYNANDDVLNFNIEGVYYIDNYIKGADLGSNDLEKIYTPQVGNSAIALYGSANTATLNFKSAKYYIDTEIVEYSVDRAQVSESQFGTVQVTEGQDKYSFTCTPNEGYSFAFAKVNNASKQTASFEVEKGGFVGVKAFFVKENVTGGTVSYKLSDGKFQIAPEYGKAFKSIKLEKKVMDGDTEKLEEIVLTEKNGIYYSSESIDGTVLTAELEKGSFDISLESFGNTSNVLCKTNQVYGGSVVAAWNAINVLQNKRVATGTVDAGVKALNLAKEYADTTGYLVFHIQNLNPIAQNYNIKIGEFAMGETDYYLVDRLGNITKKHGTQIETPAYQRVMNENLAVNYSEVNFEGFTGYVIVPVNAWGSSLYVEKGDDEVVSINEISFYTVLSETNYAKFNFGEIHKLAQFDGTAFDASLLTDETRIYKPLNSTLAKYSEAADEYCEYRYLKAGTYSIKAATVYEFKDNQWILVGKENGSYDCFWISLPQALINENGYTDFDALGIKAIAFDVENLNESFIEFIIRLSGEHSVTLNYVTGEETWQFGQNQKQYKFFETGLVKSSSAKYVHPGKVTIVITLDDKGFVGSSSSFPTLINPLLKIFSSNMTYYPEQGSYDMNLSNIRFLNQDGLDEFSYSTIGITGSDATLNVNIDGTAYGNGTMVKAGTEVEVELILERGYELSVLTYKGVNDDSATPIVLDENNKAKVVITSDTSFYYIVDEIEYTITYEVPEGLEHENPEYYYLSDETFELEDPTVIPEGYLFLGWTDANDRYIYEIDTTKLEDLVVKAKLEADPNYNKTTAPKTTAPKTNPTTARPTTAPKTNAPTAKPTSKEPTEPKKGCGSSLALSIAILPMAVAGICVLRKKENE